MEIKNYETEYILTIQFVSLDALNAFREEHLTPKKEKRGSKTAQRHSATREFLYHHPELSYKEAYKIIGDTIKLDNLKEF